MLGDPEGRSALIGGFLPLERPGSGGMADLWRIDAGLAWGNATSAFAALVRHLEPGAVWMPGYLCLDFALAVPQPLRRFFALTPDLSPDPNALAGVQPGDLVLAVDYFGRAPAPAWRAFVTERPEVTFIEDCAQALDAGPAWGDWRLYSPRKVLGIPEGGLLVPLTARARAQRLAGPELPCDPETAIARMAPLLARAEAPNANQLWRPLHLAAERGQVQSGHAMSRAALALLSSLDPRPAAERRIANYRRLARALADLALFPGSSPDFVPLGFPIVLPPERRDAVLSHLHGQGIFAAVHWREIAAPPHMLEDHRRAKCLVTLPCDPGLGPAEMDRVAREVRKAMS